jgi:integrase
MKRGRGEGRIFQPMYRGTHGEIKKVATWWIQDQRAGDAIREASGSTRRSDAVRLLRDRLSALAQGRPAGPDVDRTTFDEMAVMLEDDFVVNARRSLKRVRGAIKHLLAAFAGQLARAVDEARIGGYVRDRRAEGAANGTINRELTALKRMFTLAARAQRVSRRPHIPMLAEATPRKGFVERDQAEAIMAELPWPVAVVVRVGYLTGWRVASELLTRQWKHIDFVGGFLRLEPGETKNNQGRMFPLFPELRETLEAQRRLTDDVERATGRIVPSVFHRNGEPIRAFRRSWERACASAGLPGLIPHDLRRSAVRNLERAGVPRSTAMAMVGHQTESIYRRYAIADEAMLREGAAKLAALHEAARMAAKDAAATRRVVALKPGGRS